MRNLTTSTVEWSLWLAWPRLLGMGGAPEEVCFRVDRLVDVDGASATSLELGSPDGLVPSVDFV